MDWMETAARQHGVLTRSQVGPQRASADWFVSRGLLRRIAPSVFVLSGAVDTPEHRAWRAALTTRGALGGVAAGYLWGMHPTWPAEPTVYVPLGRARTVADGVLVVRRDLPGRQSTELRGLPVTNRAVTALDMVSELPLSEALPFADRAMQQRWVSPEAAQRRLRTSQRGNPQLRRVMRLLGPGKAESEAERRGQRFLREAGVTGWVPLLELWIQGRKVVVDIAFHEARLAVEIDGFAYHSGSDRFEQDRIKQNLLVSAGWTVLRFSWRDLTERPDDFVATVCQVLAAAA